MLCMSRESDRTGKCCPAKVKRPARLTRRSGWRTAQRYNRYAEYDFFSSPRREKMKNINGAQKKLPYKSAHSRRFITPPPPHPPE